MEKYKKSTIALSVTLALSTIVLLTSSITLGVLNAKLRNKINDSEFKYNDYSYFRVADQSNYVWDKDPILFATDTRLGDEKIHGAIFDSLTPRFGSETYFRTETLAYGSPVYEDSKLIGYVGNDATPESDNEAITFSDFEGNRTTITNVTGDHEFFVSGNSGLFIANPVHSSDIVYVDDFTKSTDYVRYDIREILGLPDQGVRTYMDSDDEIHTNSFDIWGDELILNSRNFSTIYGIKFFEDGKILSPEEVELDWVLPSDPTAIYFVEDDEQGDHPINISLGITNQNDDYDPSVVKSYQNKIINPFVDGKLYDLEDKDQAKQYHGLATDEQFFGEHRVSVLNKLLEQNNILDIDYDENLLYLSIHDNHRPGDKGNNLYSIWADDKNDWKENGKDSYTKILAVNTTNEEHSGVLPMSYNLILNYNNSEISHNDMYSNVCASSLFFSLKENETYHNYLTTNSATSNAIQLIEFDSVDTTSKELINPELVFELNWDWNDFGFLYRGYTIFEDLTDSLWGWNLMEMQK